uniref:Uncharacterized protein n=1 Tax=Solanum tuberosum TaxID=4113 RepID=M1DMC7_SOLTU
MLDQVPLQHTGEFKDVYEIIGKLEKIKSYLLTQEMNMKSIKDLLEKMLDQVQHQHTGKSKDVYEIIGKLEQIKSYLLTQGMDMKSIKDLLEKMLDQVQHQHTGKSKDVYKIIGKLEHIKSYILTQAMHSNVFSGLSYLHSPPPHQPSPPIADQQALVSNQQTIFGPTRSKRFLCPGMDMKSIKDLLEQMLDQVQHQHTGESKDVYEIIRKLEQIKSYLLTQGAGTGPSGAGAGPSRATAGSSGAGAGPSGARAEPSGAGASKRPKLGGI